MFDTYVTVVGNVLTAPEWRRTTQSGTLVANFKVASTARRLDRESGRWIDGNSLRVRVNCWRKLAEGVASSVMVGDPVVVVGRLYTRDWTDDAGNHRTMYELEAVAIGHDLSRGRGRFARNRVTMATSSMEEAEAEARVHGEITESVSAQEAPALPDERLIEDDGEYRGLPIPHAQGFESAPPPDPGVESADLMSAPFGGGIDLDGLPTAEVAGPDDELGHGAGSSVGVGYGPLPPDVGGEGTSGVGAGTDESERGGTSEEPGHDLDRNELVAATSRVSGTGNGGRGRSRRSI